MDELGSNNVEARSPLRDERIESAAPGGDPASVGADQSSPADTSDAAAWAAANLLPAHLLHLRASGLTDETIEKARIRSVTDPEEARSILRWMPTIKAPPVPAIAFPYLGTDAYVRLRPDKPIRNTDDHERKYESPMELRSEIYMPVAVNPAIEDRSVELWLCEGEKKTLIACQVGLAAVGAPGVTNFHDAAARKEARKEGRDDVRPHPSLMSLVQQLEDTKREVTIAFDSDIDENQNVQHAAATLIKMVRSAGSRPNITFITCNEHGEKLGLDDLFVELGCDAVKFRATLDDAKRPCAPDQLLEWIKKRWSAWDHGTQQRELRRAIWIVKRTCTPDELKRWMTDARSALKVTKDRLRALLEELRDDNAIAEEQAAEESDWMRAPGYAVFAEGRNVGVWVAGPLGLEKKIAPQPINVVEILTDEHHRIYETLRFRYGDREITRTVPRGLVAGRDLQGLSDFGAPVVAPTCAQLQLFLQEQEQHHYERILKLPAYTQFGWTTDLQGFVLGRRVIGLEGRSLVEADETFLSALQPGGDEREHRELMLEARRASIFGELGEAAGVAAVLIRLLLLRSLLLSVWGKSLGGKSATQAVAVSHFGRPEGVRLTANSTQTALEGALKRSRDLPLWVDDTQLAQSRELLEMIAYQVGAETGKGRGTPTGDLRPLANWNSLAIVSGEKPLIKLGAAQGARNRTLEFRFEAFAEPTFPSYLHRQLRIHHGHTGPALVRALQERVVRAGKLETLRSVYSAIADRIGDTRTEKIDQIALLATGSFVSRVFAFGEDERDAVDEAVLFGRRLHHMARAAADVMVDRIQAGHELIWAWVNEQLAEFGEGMDKQRRRYGVQLHRLDAEYKGKTVYAIFRDPLQECARKNGFDLEEVLHGLRDRRKLIEGEVDGKGSRRMQVRTKELGGARAYHIVFDDDDASAAAAGNGDDTIGDKKGV